MSKGCKRRAGRPAGHRPPVREAILLWRLLNKKGRLSPKTHDEKFVRELRSNLKISPSITINQHLRSARTSTTEFMLAVLSALQPLGRMLSDIYALFEKHGIKRSDGNIHIEFDFGAAHKMLKFNANHFRRAFEAHADIMETVQTHLFSYQDLLAISHGINRQLNSAIGELPDAHRPENTTEPFFSWRHGDNAQRMVSGRWWPYVSTPPLPTWDVSDPLRGALNPFVTAILSLCEIASRYPNWEEMWAATVATKRLSDVGDHLRALVSSWDRTLQGYYFSDNLVERFLLLIWDVHDLAPTERSARATLARQIENVVGDHSTPTKSQIPAKALQHFLDLPVWKHRSKIYSIWLVTIVARTFAHPGSFELCGINGNLVFAFTETLLARIRWNRIEMHLVGELRTPAGGVRLTGKGRIDNIQPDYVLRRAEITTGSAAMYVLEAKQYDKASLQNFARALRDYAAVHTDALVGLANYGSVTANIDKTVAALAAKMHDKDLVTRCAAFGNVEPSFPRSVDALCDHMRSAIPEPEPDAPVLSATLLVDVSQSMLTVLPPLEERADLWSNLQLTRMSVVFAADGFNFDAEGISGNEVGMLARTHLQHSAFAMAQIEPSRLEGTIFLTDESGFEETSPYHTKLAAIIVLCRDHAACLYVNAIYRAIIEATIPRLFYCPTVTVTDFS